jgi:chemotaxis protein methyltransferase CheR
MYTVDFISVSDANFLISKIKSRFKIDFSNFSMPVLRRRVHKFLMSHNINSANEIIDLIESDNRLFEMFMHEMSIVETAIFRDAEFWNFIENDVLVKLLSKNNRVKIWFPDCVGGAEFRTLAIILKETGYVERTDILVSTYNEIVLNSISTGVYDLKQSDSDKANYNRYKNYEADFSVYYKTQNGRTIIDLELHKNIQFAKIDLVRDMLPENINLIIYRNKLLYFDDILKDRIKNILSASLSKNGFIAIGIKEQFNTKGSDLILYNSSERIYLKQK